MILIENNPFSIILKWCTKIWIKGGPKFEDSVFDTHDRPTSGARCCLKLKMSEFWILNPILAAWPCNLRHWRRQMTGTPIQCFLAACVWSLCSTFWSPIGVKPLEFSSNVILGNMKLSSGECFSTSGAFITPIFRTFPLYNRSVHLINPELLAL